MRASSHPLLFAGALCCATFATKGAAQSGVATGPIPTLSAARVSARAALQSAPTAADTIYLVRRKQPVGAGLLSYVYPGVGSFYAGHTRHGVTHLAVAMGAMLALMGSAIDEEASPRASAGTALVGIYLVNWGWSIVSAVNDARAVNRAAARVTPPR